MASTNGTGNPRRAISVDKPAPVAPASGTKPETRAARTARETRERGQALKVRAMCVAESVLAPNGLDEITLTPAVVFARQWYEAMNRGDAGSARMLVLLASEV